MPVVRVVTNRGIRVRAASTTSTSDSYVGKVTISTTEPITLSDGTTTSPVFTFPYAPNDVSIDGLADQYDQLSRPGRKPLLQRSSPSPLQISISSVVTSDRTLGAGTYPVEDNLLLLKAIAQGNKDIIISGLLGKLHWKVVFRMTDLRVDATRFNNLQQMTIANVTMQFTEVGSSSQTIPGMIAIADVPVARPPTPRGKPRSNSGKKSSVTETALALWQSVSSVSIYGGFEQRTKQKEKT